MPPKSPDWIKSAVGYVGSVLLGVVVGAFTLGRQTAEAEQGIREAARIAREAHQGFERIDPRVTALEQWRAAEERERAYIRQMLEEIRADLRNLKGR